MGRSCERGCRLLVLALAVVSAASQGINMDMDSGDSDNPMVGAWTPLDVTNLNPELLHAVGNATALVNVALAEAKAKGPLSTNVKLPLKACNISAAEMQIVTGTNYKLTLTVVDSKEPTSRIFNLDVAVNAPLPGSGLSWTILGSEHADSDTVTVVKKKTAADATKNAVLSVPAGYVKWEKPKCSKSLRSTSVRRHHHKRRSMRRA